jgi:protein TonB
MRLPEGMSKPAVFSALFHGSILAAFLLAWPKELPRPADAGRTDSIVVMIVSGGGIPVASAPSASAPSPSDSETADRKSAPPAPPTGNAPGEMALDETDFADEPEPKPMTMAELPLEAMPEPPPPIEEALEIQKIVEKPAAEEQQAVQKPKPLPAMKPTPPRETTTKPAPPQPLERQLASLLAANAAVTDAPASTAATSVATEGDSSSDKASPSQTASRETGGNAGTPTGSSVMPGPSTAEQADYASLLAAWLDRHKEYPDRARRKHQEGIVLCEFAIDREGHVLRYRIVQGSGYTLLDEEASDLMARANSVPPPPLGMDQTYLVPIVFALN